MNILDLLVLKIEEYFSHIEKHLKNHELNELKKQKLRKIEHILAHQQ